MTSTDGTRPARTGVWSGAVAPLDVPWLLVESNRQPTHVAGLVILEPPGTAQPDFADELYRQMVSFDAPSPPFDRQLKRGIAPRLWPRWELRPVVRIADHLKLIRLVQPGGPSALERAVAGLHRARLDRSRPLWEVHLIDGLAENRFALYAKFHHSLVDGVGAIRILRSAFSVDSSERGLAPVWAYPRSEVRRGTSISRRDRLRAFPAALSATIANYRRKQAAKPYSAPASALNTPISSERTIAMMTLNISRLERLAAAIGGSVNDAFVAVCSTALRWYLLEHGLLPDRTLTAAMPVSVRPEGTFTGNAITFAFVSLATDVADDVERVRRIVASTKDSKAHLAGLSKAIVNTYTVLTMAPLIISQLLGLGAVTPPMFNLVISNVPGPKDRLYYNGVTVTDIYPISLLQPGQALNITALSYVDQLNVTITGCDARLPDIAQLSTFCTVALQELENAFAIERDRAQPR